MNLQKIKAIIEKGEFRYYGIRGDDRKLVVGFQFENSFDYSENVPEELEGTSATEIRDINGIEAAIEIALDFNIMNYDYKHLYLVGSDVADNEFSQDEYETLMRFPKILEVIN